MTKGAKEYLEFTRQELKAGRLKFTRFGEKVDVSDDDLLLMYTIGMLMDAGIDKISPETLFAAVKMYCGKDVNLFEGGGENG